jgi:FkbM family methyltransferase
MPSILNALRRLRQGFSPKTTVDLFVAATTLLGPGDITIDCGANVGDYTILLARSGAAVHAFEPDPVAFEVLVARTSGFANVVLHNKAISNTSGFAKLYLHEARARDPLFASTGSSLLATKTNVNTDTFIEVEAIRFSDFVADIGAIAILKMDIEGHEIEVINDLIDTGTISHIKSAFVELHDKKNPHLTDATQKLRSRIQKTSTSFDLTWH